MTTFARRSACCAAVVAALLAASPAAAEAAPMQKGDPSPFAGLLLPPADAARIMADKKAVPEVIAAEVKKVREEVDSHCKLQLAEAGISARQQTAILRAQVDTALESSKQLAKQLEDAQSAAKWTPVWITTSAVGGVVVGVLTASLISKL